MKPKLFVGKFSLFKMAFEIIISLIDICINIHLAFLVVIKCSQKYVLHVSK